MKGTKVKWLLSLACSLALAGGLSLTAMAGTGDLEISEKNFPDEVFREYVITNYDKDQNNLLSEDERNSVTEIYKLDKELSSLKGIEYFENLEALTCWGNKDFIFLDVSNNSKLIRINIVSSSLTEIDLSHSPELKSFYCRNGCLTKLDFSNNPNLTYIDCGGNLLTSLDFSKNPKLKTIDCSENPLTSLDISHNLELNSLEADLEVLLSMKDQFTDQKPYSTVAMHSYVYAELEDDGRSEYVDLSKIENFDRSLVTWGYTKPSGNKLIFDSGDHMASGKYRLTDKKQVDICICGIGLTTILENPADVSIESGNVASFIVKVSKKPKSYQWQKSTDGGKTWVNSASAGAKSETFALMTKSSYNGMQFRCVIIDDVGRRLVSTPAKLTIKTTGPAISTQPTAQSVKAGENVTFKVAATGDGLTYQWQKSSDGTTWANSASAGAKTDTLTMATKSSYNGMQFRCVITDKNGKKVTSAAVKLTVAAAGPAITTQPAAQSVKAGETVTFKVAATGDGLTYQWQKSSDGSTWVNSASTGAKTDTLTMATKSSYNGLQFRCVVTDKNGKKVTSTAAKLTVAGGPAITTQPTAQSVKAGENVTFKVAATGDGLTYQWQKSSDGKTWISSTSTGAKTNTLTMTTKSSFNGLQFRCVVTDKNGQKVISSAVKLTVQ